MKCIYCDNELAMEEMLGYEYIYCCGMVQTEEEREEFYKKLYFEIIKASP
ncbi:hypothetical protein KCG48_10370 [Proteiniclasticum sp. BAD-10]|uniref:Uncharacterized protein n=1 Tax=Proteiniclasticum sediminis TaxID=2804028 RepID=A0A941CPY0_9CLOT|nr:hypothetical protein [Proteiniclasticum sediminis]MBR0576736.1 hypothetical protein [Proteiniclasticum sediminis]